MTGELDGDTGVTWRVIGTDTESDSGVAPACPFPDVHVMVHGDVHDGNVYDECCGATGPHLQCWTPAAALEVCAMLNRLGVEVCS